MPLREAVSVPRPYKSPKNWGIYDIDRDFLKTFPRRTFALRKFLPQIVAQQGFQIIL